MSTRVRETRRCETFISRNGSLKRVKANPRDTRDNNARKSRRGESREKVRNVDEKGTTFLREKTKNIRLISHRLVVVSVFQNEHVTTVSLALCSLCLSLSLCPSFFVSAIFHRGVQSCEPRNNENVIFRDAYYYHRRQDTVLSACTRVFISPQASSFSRCFVVASRRVPRIRSWNRDRRASVAFVQARDVFQLASLPLPQILPPPHWEFKLARVFFIQRGIFHSCEPSRACCQLVFRRGIRRNWRRLSVLLFFDDSLWWRELVESFWNGVSWLGFWRGNRWVSWK